MRFFLLAALLALCVTYVMPNKTISPFAAAVYNTEQFASRFLRTFDADYKNKNLVVSPISVYFALGMLAYGAKGETFRQMRDALHLRPNDDMNLMGFEELINYLRSIGETTLGVANKIYIHNTFKVKTEYKKLVVSHFHSEIGMMNVNKKKETVEIVNKWVSDNTCQKIKNMLQENDVIPQTRMIILNAIYFKGKWVQKFEKNETEDKIFYSDEKNEVQVPMMHQKAKMVYVDYPELRVKIVLLPYENTTIQMAIFVPYDTQGLSKVEEKLKTFDRRRFFLPKPTKQLVDLYLPKFKIETNVELHTNLKQLGIVNVFNEIDANLTGIADDKLKVSEVIQKAFIEVDEEGTEAAAATVVKISRVIEEAKLVTVDRPFLFMIGGPNVILFQGHVYEPLLE